MRLESAVHADDAEAVADEAEGLRGSGTRVRAAPLAKCELDEATSSPESSTSRVIAEIPTLAPPSDEGCGTVRTQEVREHEERLVAAIKSRDLPKALTAASVLVYMDPAHTIAKQIKERCAKQLHGARTRSFPRHDAVPTQSVPWAELSSRSLSRRQVYLLHCIDGRLTVEEVIDMSAMAPLAAFEALDALVRDGIVDLA